MYQNYWSLIIAFQWDDNFSPPHMMFRSFLIVWAFMLFLEILISAYCLSCSKNPSFVSKRPSHIAFLMANVRAIYLVLVDDNAIVVCFFKHQLTGPLFSMKIKSDVDFWLSLSLAQSESKYPSTKSLSWPPYMIFWSFESFR